MFVSRRGPVKRILQVRHSLRIFLPPRFRLPLLHEMARGCCGQWAAAARDDNNINMLLMMMRDGP